MITNSICINDLIEDFKVLGKLKKTTDPKLTVLQKNNQHCLGFTAGDSSTIAKSIFQTINRTCQYYTWGGSSQIEVLAHIKNMDKSLEEYLNDKRLELNNIYNELKSGNLKTYSESYITKFLQVYAPQIEEWVHCGVSVCVAMKVLKEQYGKLNCQIDQEATKQFKCITLACDLIKLVQKIDVLNQLQTIPKIDPQELEGLLRQVESLNYDIEKVRDFTDKYRGLSKPLTTIKQGMKEYAFLIGKYKDHLSNYQEVLQNDLEQEFSDISRLNAGIEKMTSCVACTSTIEKMGQEFKNLTECLPPLEAMIQKLEKQIEGDTQDVLNNCKEDFNNIFSNFKKLTNTIGQLKNALKTSLPDEYRLLSKNYHHLKENTLKIEESASLPLFLLKIVAVEKLLEKLEQTLLHQPEITQIRKTFTAFSEYLPQLEAISGNLEKLKRHEKDRLLFKKCKEDFYKVLNALFDLINTIENLKKLNISISEECDNLYANYKDLHRLNIQPSTPSFLIKIVEIEKQIEGIKKTLPLKDAKNLQNEELTGQLNSLIEFISQNLQKEKKDLENELAERLGRNPTEGELYGKMFSLALKVIDSLQNLPAWSEMAPNPSLFSYKRTAHQRLLGNKPIRHLKSREGLPYFLLFQDRIGNGQFNEAHFVHDIHRKTRHVYRKLLNKEMRLDWEKEVGIQQRLAPISHILPIDAVFSKDDDERGILLPYCEGGDLEKAMEEGQITEEQATFIMVQLLTAVRDMHEAKIEHKDLKPANIFLKNPRDIRIADFGLSELFNTATGINGSPSYMPPEAWRSNACREGEGDAWAAGVIAYELRYGLFPLYATAAQLRKHYPFDTVMKAVSSKTSQKDDPYNQMIIHLLNKDPKKRWTIGQALAHLQN